VQFAKTFVAVSVVVTAFSCSACRKSSQETRATEEAELRASETTITSGEVGDDDALREQAATIAGTRNDQLAYRAKLRDAIDELDAKRRQAKRRGSVHVKVVEARRDVLKHHLDALERTTDTEWGSLKAKIDRDLAEGK